MKRAKKVITRRDFLKTGSAAALGSLVGLNLIDIKQTEAETKSRVVLIRNERVVNGDGQLNRAILKAMLDKAMITLMDVSNPVASWKKLFKPTDIVGIKSNVWHYLPTPYELEEEVKEGLISAGVLEKNMAVDDRGVLYNSIFQKSTALINVRPMRTHHWSGLGTLLKNYIMFVNVPYNYHGNACERLGSIWKKSHVADKTRLNILVMLTPLFHGIGPHHFSSKYVWNYNGLIVSTDPVAADATGTRIIQAKRNIYFGKERPISPVPHHILAADRKYGLGNSSPEKIELLKLGWEKEILI